MHGGSSLKVAKAIIAAGKTPSPWAPAPTTRSTTCPADPGGPDPRHRQAAGQERTSSFLLGARARAHPWLDSGRGGRSTEGGNDSRRVRAARCAPRRQRSAPERGGGVPHGRAELGDRLRRIPDGETGPRADWIVWQYPVLSSRPQFEVAPPTPRLRTGRCRVCACARARAATTSPSSRSGTPRRRSPRSGRSACSSATATLPRGCRFQVSLPTPLAPISAFVAPDDQAVVERAYEAAIVRRGRADPRRRSRTTSSRSSGTRTSSSGCSRATCRLVRGREGRRSSSA